MELENTLNQEKVAPNLNQVFITKEIVNNKRMLIENQ